MLDRSSEKCEDSVRFGIFWDTTLTLPEATRRASARPHG
jgi:hypothetical protein